MTYAVNWDIANIPGGSYTVLFRLTDVDGASAEHTATITVDHSVPERIANVAAVGDLDGIMISWSIASEIDTTRYRIYRRSELESDFRRIANINNRNTLSFRDTNVVEDRLYYYYVVGVNSFGREGEPSAIVAAMRGIDEEPPTVRIQKKRCADIC